MFLAVVHLLSIKDLKDLSLFFRQRDTIDMQVLKDLKRFFHGVRVFRKSCRLTDSCAVRDQAIPNYSLLRSFRT